MILVNLLSKMESKVQNGSGCSLSSTYHLLHENKCHTQVDVSDAQGQGVLELGSISH